MPILGGIITPRLGEVVIKPIGRRLEKVPGLAGATELGENRAALVVDMTSLAAEALGAGAA